MKEELTHRILKVLNEAFELDPQAMEALMEQRVPCNDKLAAHPSIQVVSPSFGYGASCAVGVLGIINGILDVPLEHRIMAVWSSPEDGNKPHLTGFRAML